MAGWMSASEIAECGLPGISGNRVNVSNWISRTATLSPSLVRPRSGRGGGLEVSIDALPDAARAELARRAQAEALVPQTAADEHAIAVEADKRQIASRISGHLTARQRAVMEARSTLLLAIDQRAMIAGCGRSKAIASFLADIGQNRLDGAQTEVVIRANDKASHSRIVSRSTIYGWFAERDRAGVIGLAPKSTREKSDLPVWFDAFLRHYQKPTKPSLLEALRLYTATLPAGATPPTERQVRLALGRMPQLARAKGREGKLAMRARMAYTARTFDDVLPTSVYVADGKTFDAEITHPIHGQPFRPELTTIIDVSTRRVVGWSASLDENTFGVVDALRMASVRHGIPAIFYTDRGPGYRNKAMDAPLTGFLARAGITPMRALPYNSQAKGVVERLNQVYTGAAKRLPTYIGKDMDKEAKLLVHKTTRRELAQVGTSRLLPRWDDFLALIDGELEAYNNRPHSSLPSFRDPQLARARHMTPAELWVLKSDGFDPVIPDDAEVADMFRPYVRRRTRRALVDWLGNSYFAQELEQLDGQDVVVGYDIHDASKVWVREINEIDGALQPGRLIAVATFNGHATRYVPLTAERAAMEKRTKGRMARLQSKLNVVGQELSPAALLDGTSHAFATDFAPLTPGVDETAGAIAPKKNGVSKTSGTTPCGDAPAVSISDALGTGERPIFRDDVSFARWCAGNPDQATETDRSLLRDLLTTHSTNELLRMSGVDLEALVKLVRSTASQAGAATTQEDVA